MPLLNSGQLLAQPEFVRRLASLRTATVPPLPEVSLWARDAFRRHRSTSDQRNAFERLPSESDDNSELSLHGDAFISLHLTRLLMADSKLRTGTITFVKGALCANRTLSRLSVVYGLHYESEPVDRNIVRVQADLFEAYVGAVCKTRGEGVAGRWLDLLFGPLVEDVLELERTAFYAPSTLDAARGGGSSPSAPLPPVQYETAADPPTLVGGLAGRERLEALQRQLGLHHSVVMSWVYPDRLAPRGAPRFVGSLIINNRDVGRKVRGSNHNVVCHQLAHNAVEVLRTDDGQRSILGRRIAYGAVVPAADRMPSAPALGPRKGSIRGQTDNAEEEARRAARVLRFATSTAAPIGGANYFQRDRVASR